MRLLRLVILVAAVAIVVFPAGRALAYPPANPVRTLPATVEKGATFNVTVNFTAPADNFSAISLTDFERRSLLHRGRQSPDGIGWWIRQSPASRENDD